MASRRVTIEEYDRFINSSGYWKAAGMREGGQNNPEENLTPSGRVYRNLPPDKISLECLQTSGNNLDCLIHSFLMVTCPAFRRRIRMGEMGVTDECGAKQFATYFRRVNGPKIVDVVYSSYAAGRNDRLSRVIAKAQENARKAGTSEEDMVNKQIAVFERGEQGKSQRDPSILIKELTGSGGHTDLADDHLLTFATYFNISVLLFREVPLVIGSNGPNTYMISNPRGGHFEAVRTMDGSGRFFLPYATAIAISRRIMESGKLLNSFTEEKSQLDSNDLRAMALSNANFERLMKSLEKTKTPLNVAKPAEPENNSWIGSWAGLSSADATKVPAENTEPDLLIFPKKDGGRTRRIPRKYRKKRRTAHRGK
jgi:hypothetical protein